MMKSKNILPTLFCVLIGIVHSAPVSLVATGGGYSGNSTESGTFDLGVASDSLLVAAVITRSDNDSTGVTINATDAMDFIGQVNTVGSRGSIYYYALELGTINSIQSGVSFTVGSANASTYFYQLAGASQDTSSILFGSDSGVSDKSTELSLTLDTGSIGTASAGSYVLAAAAHGKDDNTTNLTFGGTETFTFNQGPQGNVSDTFVGWASAANVDGSVQVTGEFTFSAANNDQRGAALASVIVTPIPEPGTFALVGMAGLAVLVAARRRR